eukprot:437545_1
MAVWKGALAVSFGCILSFAINKSKYCKNWRFLKLLPLVPAWFALTRKLGPGYIIDRGFVSAGHCLYHSLVALSMSKWIPFEYGILFVYAPLPLVFERKSFALKEATHGDIFYKYYIQLFWSLPIISSMKLLSSIHQIIPNISYVERGIHAPMISIINHHICVGRVPLNSCDVDVMRNEPYNIGAVVNMCIETTGPIDLYKRHGIKYIQNKTVDTLPPKLCDISSAMDFIEAFVCTQSISETDANQNNEKRVLIHCRGGRSRSATVALCWLLKSKMHLEDAMNLLTTQRKAVHDRIQFYDVVYEFSRHCLQDRVDKPQKEKIKRLLSFDL